MTKKELEEGNHLIANFNGDFFDGGLEPSYYIRNNKEYKLEDAKFYTSFDWLASPIQKIYKLDLEWFEFDEVIDSWIILDLEGCWTSLVKLIKKYNKVFENN